MGEKKMTARRYLGQLQDIDEMIRQDLERLEEMKHDLVSIGSTDYGRERVQSSPAGDRLCSDVARVISMNDAINAEIDRFVDAREQIIREIRGLHSAIYNSVLYKVYVQFKIIRQAADEMKISYRYAVQIHNQALKAFGETYQNLHYLT